MTKQIVIFGHGYSAEALSSQLLDLGWRVVGTTRSEDKAEALRAKGVEAVVCNLRFFNFHSCIIDG